MVCTEKRNKKTEPNPRGKAKVEIFVKKPSRLLLALIMLAVVLFPGVTLHSLAPHEAPDPSQMIRQPIWAGDFRIILCFEEGQYYMYRMEKLPFQFSVHGSGWQEYVTKTSGK